MKSPEREIRKYYEALIQQWGPQHWWPAESAFEVVVGAFLTQNTSWTNVEKALANLREAGALNIGAVRGLKIEGLQDLIRPAGYFRQKAQRLKAFVAWLDVEFAGSLDAMFARETEVLRAELLMLNGVGPETADSILCYAGQKESFVVDAYTRRIFERHGIVDSDAKYEEIRQLVEAALAAETAVAPARVKSSAAAATKPDVHPPSPLSGTPRSELARRLNEFHGLIVQVGKHHCLKAAPRCEGCPLQPWLP